MLGMLRFLRKWKFEPGNSQSVTTTTRSSYGNAWKESRSPKATTKRASRGFWHVIRDSVVWRLMDRSSWASRYAVMMAGADIFIIWRSIRTIRDADSANVWWMNVLMVCG